MPYGGMILVCPWEGWMACVDSRVVTRLSATGSPTSISSSLHPLGISFYCKSFQANMRCQGINPRMVKMKPLIKRCKIENNSRINTTKVERHAIWRYDSRVSLRVFQEVMSNSYSHSHKGLLLIHSSVFSLWNIILEVEEIVFGSEEESKRSRLRLCPTPVR